VSGVQSSDESEGSILQEMRHCSRRVAAEKSNNALIRMVDAPSSENLAGERKTVTTLFADIKGSTELMEDLDPEEARAIIDPALKLMIDAVQRYDDTWCIRPATASSHCSGRRWRTRTVRSERSMQRYGCKRS
jgi:class 3 adenylate cyclase